MTIDIHITAASAAEATKELLTLAYAITGNRVTSAASAPAPSTPVDAPALEQPTVIEPAPAEPTTTLKKPRAKKEAPKVETPVETADTKTQDAADEQEESNEAAGAPLTHDSVRDALGKYVNKFGIDAAQADGPKVFVLLFGAGKTKVSDIPNDQESFKKAIAGVEEMLEKNPFGRDAVKAA